MTDPDGGTERSRPAWRHGAAVAVLLGVTLLFYSALLKGRTYSDVSRYQTIAFPWSSPGAPSAGDRIFHFDQAKSYYPWQAFMTASYRGGEVPLWNPYSFAGTPFLAANANNALYPPRIALSKSRLSPTRVHDVFTAGHMFLAGLAMYLLLVYFRASFAGALLGAVGWMASSFMIAWVALEHFVVVAALLPIAVLLADASIRRRSWPAALALGLVLALLFLGGNVLFVELSFAAVFLHALSLVLGRFLHGIRSRAGDREVAGSAGDLARLAVPWLLFGGLAAVSMLPTAELVGSTRRTPLTYAELSDYALPWSGLVRLYVPPDSVAGLSFHHDAYHVALFCGTLVGLLAIVGIGAQRTGAWFARVLALVTLLIALGTPVLALPYVLIPGFDSFKPLGRILFLAAFAICILAAFGLDTVFVLLRAWVDGRRATIATAVVGALAIAVTAGQLRVYSEGVMHDQEATAADIYPPTPLVEKLRREPSSRFLPVGRVFPGSTSLVYPLRNAAGYESIVPGRVQDFWRVVAGLPVKRLTEPLPFAFEPVPEFGVLRADLLWRAGVTYVAAPPRAVPSVGDREWLDLAYDGEDGRVFRVRDALPRAYLVAGCVTAASSRTALVRFQEDGFDPRSAVILEEGDVDTCPEPRLAGGSARIVEESVNAVTVEVDAQSEAFLVVNDTWDPGWRATVGGREVDVLPANSLFRAVRVGPDRQTVEFHYSPRSYEVGRSLSLATFALLLGFFGVLAARRFVRPTSELAEDNAQVAGITSKRPGANP